MVHMRILIRPDRQNSFYVYFIIQGKAFVRVHFGLGHRLQLEDKSLLSTATLTTLLPKPIALMVLD